MNPQFIDKRTVAALLSMRECIEVMEKMFRLLAAGDCVLPLRSLMWLPDRSGLLGMMPSYSASLGLMGIKLISVFHENARLGYPSHQGAVMLFDAVNGAPLAILDAEEITSLRTAAASAVATRLLSRSDAHTLAVIGSGEQASRHIEAIPMVREITQINIWSRNLAAARALADRHAARSGMRFAVFETAREAVAGADIICTTTSSAAPVLEGAWLSPGIHINAVGASSPNARELDTDAVKKAKLFADCYESVYHEAGDFLVPKREGVITDAHVRGEISEVLSGLKPGRENDAEITLFKSLGIGTEDLFSAAYVYEKLRASK